jgi:hypothetical protein
MLDVLYRVLHMFQPWTSQPILTQPGAPLAPKPEVPPQPASIAEAEQYHTCRETLAVSPSAPAPSNRPPSAGVSTGAGAEHTRPAVDNRRAVGRRSAAPR